MRYKPERALTLHSIDANELSTWRVAMRYKPERALTQKFLTVGTPRMISVAMRYKPERALTPLWLLSLRMEIRLRSNEVQAREGIDTPVTPGWGDQVSYSVAMRYKPERALTLYRLSRSVLFQRLRSNEVQAREGVILCWWLLKLCF